MENIPKISFLPSYSYRIKKIGFIALTISVLLLVVFLLTKSDTRVISWFIAFSLSVITFSKDKNYQSKNVLLQYYSLKLAFSFLIGFVLAIYLMNYLLEKSIPLNSIYLLIFVLLIYQTCYTILRYQYKKDKVEIIENTVIEAITKNFKLHFTVFIISVVSLILFYVLNKG